MDFFCENFSGFLEKKKTETLIQDFDCDFIGRKICRNNPQKLTKIEYLLLFVIFLKMHSKIDDHENSIITLNYLVDIQQFERNKTVKIKRAKKTVGKKYNPYKYEIKFESSEKSIRNSKNSNKENIDLNILHGYDYGNENYTLS